MIGLTQRIEKIESVKDLKPLRNQQWFIDCRDFDNWIKVASPSDRDKWLPIQILINSIPKNGPFRAIREDMWRYLAYEWSHIKQRVLGAQ